MKLHSDKAAFEYIIEEISSIHSVKREVLEKDYYVSLLLWELSKKENQSYAYFKGGTALYKALKSIRRFSEDIDLTVLIEDCPTASQAKKRLENATLKYTCMPKGETLENHKGSITCEYIYDSMYTLDEKDALQRYGKVKVEATSFTVSEPTERTAIAPHLYELANDEQKKILRERYEVRPFEIETISLERIFIDKVFAAQFYFERGMFKDVAKHIYDLTVLLDNETIKTFLEQKDRVAYIVSLKRKEEQNRLGGINPHTKIADFEYFRGLRDNREFDGKFKEMQQIYVFNKNDVIAEETVIAAITRLREIMDYEWEGR